jgi:hypothetical protein
MENDLEFGHAGQSRAAELMLCKNFLETTRIVNPARRDCPEWTKHPLLLPIAEQNPDNIRFISNWTQLLKK